MNLRSSPKAGFAWALVFAAILVLAETAGANATPLPPPNSPGLAACAVLRDSAEMPGFWLGHFSGGRVLSPAPGLKMVDWQNDYTCFPTLRSCNAWRGEMRRVYRGIQGYTTCLRIR